jgi:hypothetical protein
MPSPGIATIALFIKKYPKKVKKWPLKLRYLAIAKQGYGI